MNKKERKIKADELRKENRLNLVKQKEVKYAKLETEKHLNPDYTKIERDALKNGFHPTKVKLTTKKRVKKNKDIPKVEQIKYPMFLETKYWLYVRKLVIERDNKTCQDCGATKLLQVHHKSYKYHFAEHKHLGDLITLCRKCHKKVHGL